MRVRELEASNGKMLPIIDSKTNMKLHVGKAELSAAKRKRPNSCALAQACMQKEGVKEVRIHLSRAYVRTNDLNWQRFMVGDNLRREIVAFDRGGKFMAGDYELRHITPSARLTGKAQGSENNNKKKSGRRRKRAYNPTQDVRLGPA